MLCCLFSFSEVAIIVHRGELCVRGAKYITYSYRHMKKRCVGGTQFAMRQWEER